jgi:anthranilate phosphoribosyltransferase
MSGPSPVFNGWPPILEALLAHESLHLETVEAATEEILAGRATPAQIAGFLVAMRAKGPNADELRGMLRAVRNASTRVELPLPLAQRAIDIVGTGGDRSHSVNISTMAALVVAGAGVPVCKHGNRASSSQCGTADVLEALGVSLDVGAAGVVSCLEEANIAFCFAPSFHPAFRHAGPARKEMGIPTVFNLLGPMANPADVSFMLVGVGDPTMASAMAEALADRRVHRSWVVHGHGGLDELSLEGETVIVETHGDTRSTFMIDPLTYGLQRADVTRIRGGDPAHNADVVRRILAGESGPVRDIVLLNAGAALVIAGDVPELGEGIERARHSIDSGNANRALEALVSVSNRHQP